MQAYQYHPVEKFPVPTKLKTEWTSIMQLGLPEPGSDDGAYSSIKYVGVSPYKNYYKFHVRHEVDRECWIRVAREDRKRAIFIEEFDIFMPPNKSYIFIRSPLKSARELLKRIKTKKQGFQYALREVDLLALKDASHSNVKGGWFRNLEIENVSTAAIFGSTVSESAEWDNYQTNGELSSLVIEFSHASAKHSLSISSSGSITLFSNYDENFALSMVERFNDLVMRFSNEFNPKTKTSSKKIK